MEIEYQPFPPNSERAQLTNQRSLVFSGIAPHPPIMVPEEWTRSDRPRARLDRRDGPAYAATGSIAAQTVILISPHAPLETDSFVAYEGPTLYGDFANFHAPDTVFSARVDEELLESNYANSRGRKLSRLDVAGRSADHGTAVPLYFLLSNGWSGQIVALGYSFLSNDDHLRFGSCITNAVDQIGRRVAFIAAAT